MKSKFFSFLDPVWNYIDSGSFFRVPFRWLYVIVAGLNLLFPFVLLFKAIEAELFSFVSGSTMCVLILSFLLLITLGGMSAALWMNRQEKVKELLRTENEYVAIPMVSYFIQTSSEWIGFYIGLFGAVSSLLCILFGMDDEIRALFSNVLPWGVSLWMVIIYPVAGYLIVVFGRLVAELYGAIASIANNTRYLVPTKSDHNQPEDPKQEDNE